MVENGEVYAMKTLNKFEMLKRAEVPEAWIRFACIAIHFSKTLNENV